MRVCVARHGETTWNLAGRYQGRRESALSARGVAQGTALGAHFGAMEPPVRRIVTSPMQRTRATAAFVAERLNLPLETDDALIEIAHGTWEGRMRDEIAANDPERYATWRERPADVAFIEGESLVDVHRRWRRFRDAFSVTAPTLLVTHDAIVRIALLDITERPLSEFWNMNVENAAYAVVEVDGSRWTLVEESVNAHLADQRASVEGQAL
jgi:broad specificity phosphatase PhoE